MSQPSNPGFAGQRVTVMGLGRFGGGVGVTRWLAGQAARVTVSDQAGPEQLGESVAALAGLDVELHLGGHDEADFTGCELLVANPAVPFDSPYLALARRAGAELTTEINLFCQRCPAPVVGITGSAGKSTTTAMTGCVLAGARTTHVGGNIGVSLLERLGEIRPGHVVVLELSSFQLSYLPLLGRSPQVAVVTNLHPNHLDRHRDMAEYAEAKKNVFRFQSPGDVLILNGDEAVADWAGEAPGRVELFSAGDEAFPLKVPGRHNQANAQAAWAAARQFGVAREAAAAALADFAGLPHRLQLVAKRDGVAYYNDSKSTTPAGALAALASFPPGKAVVIAGGYDKRVELSGLCEALAGRAKAVVATGQTGEQIARAVEAAGKGGPVIVARAGDLAEAVGAARRLAASGDVVLLSPACASYDQFRDYQQRGEAFTRLVGEV